MNIKKVISILVIATTILSLLASCGGDGGKSETDATSDSMSQSQYVSEGETNKITSATEETTEIPSVPTESVTTESPETPSVSEAETTNVTSAEETTKEPETPDVTVETDTPTTGVVTTETPTTEAPTTAATTTEAPTTEAPVTTAPPPVTTATPPVTTVTPPVTTNPPETEPVKTDPITRVIINSQLGIRVKDIDNPNTSLVDVTASRDYITVVAKKTGTTTVNFTDWFGHTASITVVANIEKQTISVNVSKCTTSFIEVGLYAGARGDNSTDDTSAFKKAIDKAKPGETVYVYPGRYKVSLIVMKEGVTLKMYTTMDKATEGYSNRIKNDFINQNIAILSGTRIQNGPHQSYGRDACSNFKIIGGAIDTNLTTRSTLIFGCANNVLVENVLFKDMKGNHTIQITGSKNVTVRNCMFAGYACGDTFTREVIQVEPSTPGSTGAAATAPLKFGEGEYNYPKNITIEGCYFGKSDEAGAPLMAIGHHSQVGKPNVNGFYIRNNVFDDVIYAAIRYNNITNVEITGNTFIATSKYKYNANAFSAGAGPNATSNPPAFIIFYSHSGKSTYSSSGKTITKATAEEQTGIHNILIENNTFTLKSGSDKRIFVNHKTTYLPGSTYVTALNRQEHYGEPVTSYTGYVVTNNYASDISFKNNTVNIEGQPTYKDHYVNLSGIYNLEFSGNKVNMDSSVSFSSTTAGQEKGVKISAVTNDNTNKLTISTQSSDKTVTVKVGDKIYAFTTKYTGKLYITKTNGVKADITTDANGNLLIEFTSANNLAFESLTIGGKVTEAGNHAISSETTINVTFK